MRKWAALVCKYIRFEEQNLAKALFEDSKKGTTMEDCEIQMRNVVENRISNVAITIDKVLYCLQ